jgi:hypothetical protein
MRPREERDRRSREQASRDHGSDPVRRGRRAGDPPSRILTERAEPETEGGVREDDGAQDDEERRRPDRRVQEQLRRVRPIDPCPYDEPRSRGLGRQERSARAEKENQGAPRNEAREEGSHGRIDARELDQGARGEREEKRQAHGREHRDRDLPRGLVAEEKAEPRARHASLDSETREARPLPEEARDDEEREGKPLDGELDQGTQVDRGVHAVPQPASRSRERTFVFKRSIATAL